MNNKLKILEFFTKEYEGSKLRILFMAFIGGLFSVILLAIINEAAELASDTTAKVEIFLCLSYAGACAVTIISKRDMLNRTLVMAEDVVRKVRVRLTDKIRHTELQFLEKTGRGEIYARIVQDTQIISQTWPNLINAFDAAFSTLAVFVYIACISMTGFILALFSLAAMYGTLFFNYAKIKDELNVAREKEGDFLDALNDTLAGFKEIKINSEKNNALFADIEELAIESQRVKVAAEIGYDKNIVSYIGMYIVALAVIVFIVPMFSRVGSEGLIKVVVAIFFILGMLAVVYRGVYSMFKANVAVENLERLEARIDEFGIYTGPPPEIPEAFREIRLNSLMFRYTGKEGETLFSVGPVDLSIKQGDVLFIIGGNGSGKSTLLKLLTGLYYPVAGDGFISLDDQRVTRRNYQTYRELFSIIFTDFHLFRKLYGLESVDEKEVRNLLTELDIRKKTDYIDGKFTNINLSTGQRKRIAYIAAVLEDKPICVFDEWAADQDPTYRRYFYEKFLRDLKAMNKTIIAVTHDDKYFDKADRIIKMEEGQMLEETIV